MKAIEAVTKDTSVNAFQMRDTSFTNLDENIKNA